MLLGTAQGNTAHGDRRADELGEMGKALPVVRIRVLLPPVCVAHT
jgi:hypothetical protein